MHAESMRAASTLTPIFPGGDMQARDNGRGLTPREWALFTGRYETAYLMYQIMMKPCAEQFCDSFSLEWPLLEVSIVVLLCGHKIRRCPYLYVTYRSCDR